MEQLFYVGITTAANRSDESSMNSADGLQLMTRTEVESFITQSEGYQEGSFKWANDDRTEGTYLAEGYDRKRDEEVVQKFYVSLR